MPSPHFLSLTALNREASLKHGLQIMLVVDQGWRPFTPGGCDSSARDQSMDIPLILHNPPKTWLLVKDQHQDRAKELFGDTGVSITPAGRPLLGSPFGKSTYQEEFISSQGKCRSEWEQSLKRLSKIAETHPKPPSPPSLMGWWASGAIWPGPAEISTTSIQFLKELSREN